MRRLRLVLFATGIVLTLFAASSVPAGPGQPPAKTEPDTKDKSVFKQLKYRLIGPYAGGRVTRSCSVAGDSLTYYTAASAGGLWKTIDGGTTWKPVFDDQIDSS